jgi:hypothetical protein
MSINRDMGDDISFDAFQRDLRVVQAIFKYFFDNILISSLLVFANPLG